MAKIEQKIPEGWCAKKLKDLSTKGIFNGIFNDPQKVGRGVPLINVVDLYQDNINFSNLSLLDVTENELDKYEAKEGDLLFTRSSLKLEGIAHCNLVKKYSERVVYDCHLMRVRTNQALAVPYYLYTFCNTKMAKQNFMSKAKTTTMTTIDQKGLGNVLILLPPLPEQEKIAGILSCWDDGIEKLSALIEKKKTQKKALMQQLLTGKHRLKGFSTPWHKVKLGNIGTTYTGLSGKDKESFGHGKPYIPYLNIYQNFVIDTNQFELVAIEDGENQNTVKYGDIFFTTSSETPDEVGISSVLLEEPKEETYLNSFCFGFRLHDFSILLPFYAAYLCRSEQIRKTMYMLAQGATRFNLSKTEFLKSYIFIPSDLAEQKAIAEILSKADEEIELLNKKHEAFKQEKKALMQQLLTGKIRVKVS